MRRFAATALCILFAAALVPMAKGGPHTAVAKGEFGWIRVWGHGTVNVSGKGTLMLSNVSNVQIKIDGTWGEKTETVDGAEYRHFEGSVHSIGTGQHLEIRGWNLTLDTKGDGKVWLQGRGTISIDGGPDQAWPEDQTHAKWLKVKYGSM